MIGTLITWIIAIAAIVIAVISLIKNFAKEGPPGDKGDKGATGKEGDATQNDINQAIQPLEEKLTEIDSIENRLSTIENLLSTTIEDRLDTIENRLQTIEGMDVVEFGDNISIKNENKAECLQLVTDNNKNHGRFMDCKNSVFQTFSIKR